MVSLVGSPGPQLLAALRAVPNVSVLAAGPGPDEDAGAAGARALREAAHRSAPYVLVSADPLAGVAGQWEAMWDLTRPEAGPAGFEAAAAAALAGWRSGQFELPDYYLVLAAAGPGEPRSRPAAGPGAAAARAAASAGPAGFHLGPLHAARPRRIAVAMTASGDAAPGPQAAPDPPERSGAAAEQARTVLHVLRSLPQGPWWPPLPELLAGARQFFPGRLQPAPGGA